MALIHEVKGAEGWVQANVIEPGAANIELLRIKGALSYPRFGLENVHQIVHDTGASIALFCNDDDQSSQIYLIKNQFLFLTPDAGVKAMLANRIRLQSQVSLLAVLEDQDSFPVSYALEERTRGVQARFRHIRGLRGNFNSPDSPPGNSA